LKPLENLNHLNLDIRQISSKAQLPEVLKLQKYIARKFRSHGYFSHTPAQLESDRLQYQKMISKKSGMILGVYQKDKLRGLMIAGIYDHPGFGKIGGFSFFLHPSIQGLGITKTGYLLLLKYLLKYKVKTFTGGTSQPAIQSMGNVMKRRIDFVLYVKMKRDP
jgi:L-amino acid N-acyltransferase YncA